MKLTPKRKAQLLAYCRLDGEELTSDEHLLLESFYGAAVEYMIDAGVSGPTEPERLRRFDLVVNSMVLHAWDHRDLSEPTMTVGNPFMRHVFNQLKLTEEASWCAD